VRVSLYCPTTSGWNLVTASRGADSAAAVTWLRGGFAVTCQR
jgi:hypothetical protein